MFTAVISTTAKIKNSLNVHQLMMGRDNVVCICVYVCLYTGILLSSKKDTFETTWRNLEDNMISEIRQI